MNSLSETAENQKDISKIIHDSGVDIPFIIQEVFLGYKYRKMRGKLYERDASLPTKLIRIYYSLNPGDIEFHNLRKSFISKYVKNESIIEGVNDESIHGKEEIAGLANMYEYLHSDEMENDFSVYSLKTLNKKLFSHTPYPECAGIYRNHDVYLPGTGIGLVEWSMIQQELYYLSPTIDYLHDYAKIVKNSRNVEELLSFLDQCVDLQVKLIYIHPFGDGNGRTIRAFINKLLEDAGLPPIYIKSNERTEYHVAMNLAIGENDYSAIRSFYRYKVCDSIIELDINDRIKRQKKDPNNREFGDQKKKDYLHG